MGCVRSCVERSDEMGHPLSSDEGVVSFYFRREVNNAGTHKKPEEFFSLGFNPLFYTINDQEFLR